jgi:hypothetical protein
MAMLLQLECPIDGLPLALKTEIKVAAYEEVQKNADVHIHLDLQNAESECLNGHRWLLESGPLVLLRIAK